MLENKERAIALIERARNLSAASLHEAAGKQGALPAAIKPLSPAFRLYSGLLAQARRDI